MIFGASIRDFSQNDHSSDYSNDRSLNVGEHMIISNVKFQPSGITMDRAIAASAR